MKSPEGKAAVEVTCGGKPIGTLWVPKSATYAWVELPDARVPLDAGKHVVPFSFGEGQPMVLQKICLTNELSSQAGK